MKIYEFRWGKESKDWVLAPNKKEATEFYINFTLCEDVVGCDVREVPKEKWSEYYLIDPNESEPDDEEFEYDEGDYHGGYKIVETFAEYAERNTQTDIIATTEY